MKSIACIGDSLTEGWGLPHPGKQSFPWLLNQAFENLHFYNFGVAGAAVQPFLDFAYQRTLAWQESHQQDFDYVLILLGTNDLSYIGPHFQQDYEQLVTSYSGKKILLTPPKTLLPQMLQNRMTAICSAIQAAAADLQTPCININQASRTTWLQEDGVHLTVQGQKELADLLKEQLSQLFDDGY